MGFTFLKYILLAFEVQRKIFLTNKPKKSAILTKKVLFFLNLIQF